MSNKTITTTIIIATRNMRKCYIYKPFKVVVLSFITNIIINKLALFGVKLSVFIVSSKQRLKI